MTIKEEILGQHDGASVAASALASTRCVTHTNQPRMILLGWWLTMAMVVCGVGEWGEGVRVKEQRQDSSSQHWRCLSLHSLLFQVPPSASRLSSYESVVTSPTSSFLLFHTHTHQRPDDDKTEPKRPPIAVDLHSNRDAWSIADGAPKKGVSDGLLGLWAGQAGLFKMTMNEHLLHRHFRDQVVLSCPGPGSFRTWVSWR